MLLVILLAVTLPLSLAIWSLSVVSSWYTESVAPPTPLRFFFSAFIPILISAWGYKRKSLDLSGALCGVVVGFVLTLSSYLFLASLFAFFISSSRATKFRSELKRKFEPDHREGGQRNWVQVLCNGGIATEFALLYVLECGMGERLADPSNAWQCTILSLAVLSALAESCGDTWASEFGSVLSRGDPFLITSFQRVPRGTNGGVSLEGLLFSGLGGAFIGLIYYIAMALFVGPSSLQAASAQCLVILVGTLAGFLGSLLDSFLGATLQFSGVHTKTGRIVERPGHNVKRICGANILDNHSVNLLSNLVTAFTVPLISVKLYSFLR